MKKVCNEKVTNIVFVCLGFVNLLSFFLLPFYGDIYIIDRTYPSPFGLLLQHGFRLEFLLPEIFFFVNVILSFILIILGFTQLLSNKTQEKKIPLSSNRNPFFIISLILLTLSVLAIPTFLINAYLNNEILADRFVTLWGNHGLGYGSYLIFPLNAVVSLLYVFLVTLITNKKSKE